MPVHIRILLCGLVVSVKSEHARLQKKPAEHCFVARPLCTHCESGAQFSHHDEGQPYFIC
jgi:hypothetical protein